MTGWVETVQCQTTEPKLSLKLLRSVDVAFDPEQGTLRCWGSGSRTGPRTLPDEVNSRVKKHNAVEHAAGYFLSFAYGVDGGSFARAG